MSDKTYRVGVAGLVHDHIWHELECWRDTGRVELVAVADTHDELLDRAKSDFQIEQQFASAAEMFSECDLDIVQICTSNTAALEVVQLAAAHEVHTVIEKPMAATLEQANRMIEVADKHNIQLMINWPFRWQANNVAAWKYIQEGKIGHVFEAHIRMAHGGPRELGCSEYFCEWLYDPSQNGGGAMVDYCSYGTVAARHLFGMPGHVQAVKANLTKPELAVEDNATITMIYENRIIQAEASWSQVPPHHDSVFLGTQGTLWTHEHEVWMVQEAGSPEPLEVQELPEGQGSGPAYFIWCLDHNQSPTGVCAASVCRDAQELLEAGKLAAESGQRVSLPLK